MGDFAIGDGRAVCSVVVDAGGVAGQVGSIHLEFVGVFLHPDLGIELPLPFSGHGALGRLRRRARAGISHPLGHDVVFREITDLAVQLDLVAGNRARVFDDDVVVLNLERLGEGDFVLVNLGVRDGYIIRAGIAFADGPAGEIGAVQLELKRVFLRADLGIKLRLPFSGNVILRRGASDECQRERRQPDGFNNIFHINLGLNWLAIR